MTGSLVPVAWWQRYLVALGGLLAVLAVIWTAIVLPAAFWYCAFCPIAVVLPAFTRYQQGFRVACLAVGSAVVILAVLGVFFGWGGFILSGVALIVAGATRVRRGGVLR